jgi:hypothetical protein
MQAQSPITHRMAALVLRSCPTDPHIYAVSGSTDYEISPSLFGNVGGKVVSFLAAQ